MSSPTALLLTLALPLTAAVLTGLFGRRPNVRDVTTLLAGALTFLVVASLVPGVMSGLRPEAVLFEVLPGARIAFRLEPLGMLFALVASGLWIVTTLYSIGYMRSHNEGHQTRFFACFAVAIFAALGVALAGNMFTLFVFYEVLTLSTYPLVSHQGNETARRGARVYLGVLLTTSIALLLPAVIWTYTIAGTLDFTEGGILAGKADNLTLGILLALYAFGIGKAALMPFHRWLPAAMVAPTPVSALLHAVAVVKAGVFTVMKVAVYIFGIDLLASTHISVWLMYAAALTIMLSSLIAMTKDNLKARLAYSTISQLSYIVLGAMLATGAGVIGGSMHIAMHAVGKITLFFCAGAIYITAKKTEVSDMRGIGRIMPVTTLAFLIGALSVIGVPPMGGSWSKWYLALGAIDAQQTMLVGVLMVSSLLNIAYLLPIPIRGFFFAPEGDASPTIKEAPLFCLVPLCATAAGCVVLFFYADSVYRLVAPVAGQ